LWRPEVFAGALILQPAPAGFEKRVAVSPSELGDILADRADEEGRQMVLHDGSGELHLHLPLGDALNHSAIVLPLGGAPDLRLDIASRFIRRVRGASVSLLPPALRLTSLQKIRLIHLLHAFDIHNVGGGARDVAEGVLASEQASLPSVEWKDSAARRRAIRLIRDATGLVNRGYLRLLRGR
jgi:hypothetical protein